MATQSQYAELSQSFTIGGYKSDFIATFEFVYTSDSTTNTFLVQAQRIKETRKNSWQIGRRYKIGIGKTKEEAASNAVTYYVKQPSSVISGGTTNEVTGAHTKSDYTAWQGLYLNNKRFDGVASTGKCPEVWVYIALYSTAGSSLDVSKSQKLTTTLVNTAPDTKVSVTAPQVYYSNENSTTSSFLLTVSTDASVSCTKQYTIDGGTTWNNYSKAVTVSVNTSMEDMKVQARAKPSKYSTWQYSPTVNQYTVAPPAPSLTKTSANISWTEGQKLTVGLSGSDDYYVDAAKLYGKAKSANSWKELASPTFSGTKGPISLSSVLSVPAPVASTTADPYIYKIRVRRQANHAYSSDSNWIYAYNNPHYCSISNVTYSESGGSVTFKISISPNSYYNSTSTSNSTQSSKIWYRIFKGNIDYNGVTKNIPSDVLVHSTTAVENSTSTTITITDTKLKNYAWYLQAWSTNVDGAQSNVAQVNLDGRTNATASFTVTEVKASSVKFKVTVANGTKFLLDGSTQKVSSGASLTVPVSSDHKAYIKGYAYSSNGVKGAYQQAVIDVSLPQIKSAAVETECMHPKEPEKRYFVPKIIFTPLFKGAVEVISNRSKSSESPVSVDSGKPVECVVDLDATRNTYTWNELKLYKHTVSVEKGSVVLSGADISIESSYTVGARDLTPADISSYSIVQSTDNQHVDYNFVFTKPSKVSIKFVNRDTQEAIDEVSTDNHVSSISGDIPIEGSVTIDAILTLVTESDVEGSLTRGLGSFQGYTSSVCVDVYHTPEWATAVPNLITLTEGMTYVCPFVCVSNDNNNPVWVDCNGNRYGES